MNQQNKSDEYGNSVINNRKKKIIGLLVVGLLVAGIGISMYFKFVSDGKYEVEAVQPDEPTFIKDGRLDFIKNEINSTLKSIDIEIADKESKRAQGLMWRRSLTDNAGMLFIFDDEEPRSFWMRNTYIPLDIIFINKSGEIVTINDDAKPLSEITIPSKIPAQFVVEVNAGFCNHFKINTGDKIKFERLKK